MNTMGRQSQTRMAMGFSMHIQCFIVIRENSCDIYCCKIDTNYEKKSLLCIEYMQFYTKLCIDFTAVDIAGVFPYDNKTLYMHRKPHSHSCL
jgi:hypothetical protein